MSVKAWLTRTVNVAEAEAANTYDGKAFGAMSREWEALKSKMLDGDTLWMFRSPKETWDEYMGVEGYAVMRGNDLVDFVITGLS